MDDIGLRRRWVRGPNGVPMKQLVQSDASVGAVLDLNHHNRVNGRGGGVGSKDMKFLARVPAASYGQWAHDWRMKGGIAGTGMKCMEYCVLKASLPDYNKFVATPSGKTGMEREARRLVFGYQQHGKGVDVRPIERTVQPIIKSARDGK